MGSTPICGLRYAEMTDAANAQTMAQNLANDLDTRLAPRFASNAARDAAITTPTNGMLAVTTDTQIIWSYNGTKWIWAHPRSFIMTADASVTNSTAFATITALNATVLANTTYHFEWEFGITGPGGVGGTGNVKFQFLCPSTSTHAWGFLATPVGSATDNRVNNGWNQPVAAATTLGLGNYACPGSPNNHYSYGRISIGVTGGTMSMQFGQVSLNVGTNFVLLGSRLRMMML